jgi:hypothetical protein
MSLSGEARRYQALADEEAGYVSQALAPLAEVGRLRDEIAELNRRLEAVQVRAARLGVENERLRGLADQGRERQSGGSSGIESRRAAAVERLRRAWLNTPDDVFMVRVDSGDAADILDLIARRR